ncbi:HD domain-containing phosphohydrolase [Streptomyces sp. AC627_RSS907]|uniref:HD domain-containing phosphohydrolase n=1 Tax=Streptomyces sp. AC627_RSS907 TaxID=2823684 RepID=UPI002665D241|nr:HD domain-containing phosphohydrolase [Streptomyces sp. AC627_RSS907]
MQTFRVAEVLAAFSLTTDMAAGMPVEKGLRTCAVATVFARDVLALDAQTCRTVYETALLRSVGCTSYASELAVLFGDEVAFQRAMKHLDPADGTPMAEQLHRLGGWTRQAADRLAGVLAEVLPTAGVEAMRNGCETSRVLGEGLGLGADTLAALDDVYERWDGLGIPHGRKGARVCLSARVVHVAEQAVLAHATGGALAATLAVERRAGGHLDPALATAFTESATTVLAPLRVPDALAGVLALEPRPVVMAPVADVTELCALLGRFVDLKSRWLIGHSEHVARLATEAARLAGMEAAEVERLHRAALLHDLGRATVSADVWDSGRPLSTADTERVRLHAYWTQRTLERVPLLAPLAALASSHHERMDGSGYHRGTDASHLSYAGRILAAADVFAALTEPRAHRDSHSPEAAAALLQEQARAGALDSAACAVVLRAAGLRPARPGHPAGLTDREVEVLRLAARGLTNQRIGERLFISDRTVGHHLAHIYDKTGRRTRAGVAVFAMEHQLLP